MSRTSGSTAVPYNSMEVMITSGESTYSAPFSISSRKLSLLWEEFQPRSRASPSHVGGPGLVQRFECLLVGLGDRPVETELDVHAPQCVLDGSSVPPNSIAAAGTRPTGRVFPILTRNGLARARAGEDGHDLVPHRL